MEPLRSPAPIGHRTMALAAADELRRRVLDGVYPGGHPLRQDALAAELGISRIPLREALVQLESEGLVKILPHRGAVVAEASADEIAELFVFLASDKSGYTSETTVTVDCGTTSRGSVSQT